ncbi:hypothetical protein KCU61_g187, partial [Aureobasidium melanogenum]
MSWKNRDLQIDSQLYGEPASNPNDIQLYRSCTPRMSVLIPSPLPTLSQASGASSNGTVFVINFLTSILPSFKKPIASSKSPGPYLKHPLTTASFSPSFVIGTRILGFPQPVCTYVPPGASTWMPI